MRILVVGSGAREHALVWKCLQSPLAEQGRVAVKADGLALGKGVIVCDDERAADAAIEAMLVRHTFGQAGATIVVEERLEGPELSVFGVCDGSRVIPLVAVRDFKRARDGD